MIRKDNKRTVSRKTEDGEFTLKFMQLGYQEGKFTMTIARKIFIDRTEYKENLKHQLYEGSIYGISQVN